MRSIVRICERFVRSILHTGESPTRAHTHHIRAHTCDQRRCQRDAHVTHIRHARGYHLIRDRGSFAPNVAHLRPDTILDTVSKR